MPLNLRPGTRIFSGVCDTELIVVKAPKTEVNLTVGGAPALSEKSDSRAPGVVQDGHGGGAVMGRRYGDAAGELELLCTKAGEGVPGVDGVVLGLREHKVLPSSD